MRCWCVLTLFGFASKNTLIKTSSHLRNFLTTTTWRHNDGWDSSVSGGDDNDVEDNRGVGGLRGWEAVPTRSLSATMHGLV